MDNTFLIIGNDEKMKSCKNRLNELHFDAECFDKTMPAELIGRFKRIILPLPTLKNGKIAGTEISLFDFKDMLNEKQVLFCGNISPEIFPCNAFSYYDNDGFLVKNSRLTAQGTLRVILENIKTDLTKTTAAVIGYGKCGKEICRLLKNAGMTITSFSRRKETLLNAEKNGIRSQSYDSLCSEIQKHDVIVNTVPCNIIDPSALGQLSKNHLYIEVASAPFGFDATKTDRLNFRYILASGLPGRYTPVSAGRNIADAVADIIKEGLKL